MKIKMEEKENVVQIKMMNMIENTYSNNVKISIRILGKMTTVFDYSEGRN